MLQIEECLARLLGAVKPIKDMEEVPLEDCCGRVLARDVIASKNVPDFPRSAMDGYAVASGDTHGVNSDHPAKLTVVGELCAGDYQEIEYEKNTCVRVMTGAFVPYGYDAVIKQEDTDYGTTQVEIYKAAKAYQNYCKPGEDLEAGTLIINKGTRLSPAHLAIMAGLGMEQAPVCRPAKVAVISTGSELIRPGEKPQPGKIYGTIGYMLMGAVKQQGLEPVMHKICGDNEAEAMSLVEEAVEKADIVITTGALSVGRKDFLPAALEKAGATLLFRGADIQPGTPTMAASLKGKPVLCLSGNPYAALANFEIYFWEAAAKLMGCNELKPRSETAVLAQEYGKVNRHRRLVRAKAQGGKVYLPAESHASSVMSNITRCNCMIDLEAGRSVAVGDKVRIRYIKGFETQWGESWAYEERFADCKAENPEPAVFCVCGAKNSGKTTLIVKLIEKFKEEGYSACTIKHDGHEYGMDHEGTDTYRFSEAGAEVSAIFSDDRFSVNGKASVDEKYLLQFCRGYDIAIIEGLKNSDYPKVELTADGKSSSGEQWPFFDRNDAEGIFAWAKKYFNLEQNR